MRIPIAVLLVMALLITVSVTGIVRAQVLSDFEVDLEGWLITGDNAFCWQETGGNPGGYLDVNDLATGDHNYAVAPPKFLGDWSGATPLDMLQADIYLDNTSGGNASTGLYMFRIAGPGGSAYAIDPMSNYPPEHIWTTYEIALDETQWTIESGTWAEILANVASFRINAEYVYGDEEVGIDNVILTLTPGIIYERCVYDDFTASGTGDWTFQNTGGASNPGSGGNGGGYVKVSDGSGHSYAFAPSRFLGDWTPLDGNGYVTIDIRVVSAGSAWLEFTDFIRITGPGGAAHVSIDTTDVPGDRRTWKTFKFPIEPATWTLDEGTWEDLLSWVSELRIDVEYYDGTESIGFDNFGRLEDACPPIDMPVLVHDPEVGYNGYHSLVGVSGVALNPMDGEIYGVVRETPGSGGGLYTVTDGDPGFKLHSYENPAHVIFDVDGDAYISEDYDGYVYRLEWGGASTLWVSGFHSGDDDPYGMTFAPPGFNGPNVTEGDIIVTDRGYSGPDEIWAFSPEVAEGETHVLPDPGNTEFFDIASTPDGTVYVCDELEPDSLFVLHPEGTLSAFALSAPVSGGIVSIVYDEEGEKLYVADRDDKAIWRVDPLTGDVTLVADGFDAFHPACLEIDAENRILWIADRGYGRVYGLNLGSPPGGLEVILSDYPDCVEPGSALIFKAAAKNTGEDPASFDEARMEITGPASLVKILYSGAPITVPPSGMLAKMIGLPVPLTAPPGMYTITVTIYLMEAELVDDSFEVEVAESCD